MTAQIYLVIESRSDYDDSWSTVRAVFDNEADANAERDALAHHNEFGMTPDHYKGDDFYVESIALGESAIARMRAENPRDFEEFQYRKEFRWEPGQYKTGHFVYLKHTYSIGKTEECTQEEAEPWINASS